MKTRPWFANVIEDMRFKKKTIFIIDSTKKPHSFALMQKS